MTVPNFVVVGAPKCGTTSLFYYLRQHPDVYLPVRKELHHFSIDRLSAMSAGPGDAATLTSLCHTFEEYLSHYAPCAGQTAVGEFSPSYLYFHDIVAPRLLERLGRVKIVVVLRDPVEKAYSQYMHLIRDQREQLTFLAALNAEDERISAKWSDIWHYQRSSRYAACVRHYMEVFGEYNVKVIFFEDLAEQPQQVMRGLCQFLGIDDKFDFDTSQVYNRSGRSRSTAISNFFGRPNSVKTLAKALIPERIRIPIRLMLLDWNTGKKEAINQEAVAFLAEAFYSDVEELAELIKRSPPWPRFMAKTTHT